MLASIAMAIGSSLKALHEARSRKLATAAAKEAFKNRDLKTELYSCSQDGTIRCWSAKTRECLRVMTLPSPANTLAATGGRLYSSHDDDRFREWNLETCEVRRYFVHNVSGSDGRVCASKDYLYSSRSSPCRQASQIKEFYLETGECTRQFDTCRKVMALCTRQNKLYGNAPQPGDWDQDLTSVHSSVIGEWDLGQEGTGQPARTFVGHKDGVTAIFVTKKRLFTGSEDGTVKEWSLESGDCARTFSGHCPSRRA